MGPFLSQGSELLPKPLILVIQLLHLAAYGISAILFYIDLNPSSEMLPAPGEDYAYLRNGTLSSAATSNSAVTPSVIKGRLRVTECRNLMKRSGSCWLGDKTTCAVCLGGFDARDKVRELGNCTHIFHKGCIDRWVEVGKVTCPLCRSQLLPAPGKKARETLLNLSPI